MKQENCRKRLWVLIAVFSLALVALMGWRILPSALVFDPRIRVEGDLGALSTQLELYGQLTGSYPSTEQGLEALVSRPTLPPTPRRWRQLMSEVPQDGWRRTYQYRFPSSKDLTTYDLFSLGEDGIESADDIHIKQEKVAIERSLPPARGADGK